MGDWIIVMALGIFTAAGYLVGFQAGRRSKG
jgi:hypothetical protein